VKFKSGTLTKHAGQVNNEKEGINSSFTCKAPNNVLTISLTGQ